MEYYYESKRKITWKVNQTIQYFEYSADGIIMDGGFGLIIAIQNIYEPGFSSQAGPYCFLTILNKAGILQQICSKDVEPVEDW